MPLNDLVPVYDPGVSQDGAPSRFQIRGELRELKKSNKGYFTRNGTIFQMQGAIPLAVIEASLQRFGAIRDESVCPTVRTMNDYVDDSEGQRRVQHANARAIIASYRGHRHCGTMAFEMVGQ